MGFTPGGQGGGSFVFIGAWMGGLVVRTLDVTVKGRGWGAARFRSPSGCENTLGWASEKGKTI